LDLTGMAGQHQEADNADNTKTMALYVQAAESGMNLLAQLYCSVRIHNNCELDWVMQSPINEQLVATLTVADLIHLLSNYKFPCLQAASFLYLHMLMGKSDIQDGQKLEVAQAYAILRLVQSALSSALSKDVVSNAAACFGAVLSQAPSAYMIEMINDRWNGFVVQSILTNCEALQCQLPKGVLDFVCSLLEKNTCTYPPKWLARTLAPQRLSCLLRLMHELHLSCAAPSDIDSCTILGIATVKHTACICLQILDAGLMLGDHKTAARSIIPLLAAQIDSYCTKLHQKKIRSMCGSNDRQGQASPAASLNTMRQEHIAMAQKPSSATLQAAKDLVRNMKEQLNTTSMDLLRSIV